MIYEAKSCNKLTGIYRGKVIRHLPHGRLKVYIPSVYSAEYETNSDLLPVAEQLTPLFAGTNKGNGVFSYPNIGSIVMCQFINGDQNFPLVIGATLGGHNSFGQYNLIYSDTITEENKNNVAVDTNIEEVNHSSPSHLITAGKTHLQFFEDGRISAITMTPNDVPVGVDFSKNELSTEYRAHDINSQFVMSNIGEISASTNDYINKINSNLILNIDGNVHIDTYSTQITSYIDMTSTGEIKIQTYKNGQNPHARIVLNAEGTIEIDSTNTINIHSKEIGINADSTITMEAPTITITGGTVNITGGSGDAVIDSISLVNHVHKENQSGDVVAAGVATTPPVK